MQVDPEGGATVEPAVHVAAAVIFREGRILLA
jgi:hypothetical protein